MIRGTGIKKNNKKLSLREAPSHNMPPFAKNALLLKSHVGKTLEKRSERGERGGGGTGHVRARQFRATEKRWKEKTPEKASVKRVTEKSFAVSKGGSPSDGEGRPRPGGTSP